MRIVLHLLVLHPRPAHRPLAHRSRRLRRALAALLAAGLLLAACADGEEVSEGDELPAAELGQDDPGLAHVHGLGVNPADDAVYVATHFGLWRLGDDGGAQRVGEAFHDLMGFTVAGPDHFLASGHPQEHDRLPPLLGLIESTDAGRTWRSVSLLGEADFHGLRAAHDRVYGWNSAGGAFMVSDDRQEWELRSNPEGLFDFAIDPDDPEHLIATAAESLQDTTALRSDDGGRSWTSLDAPALLLLAWSETERLWGVDREGAVWRSEDGGDSWQEAGQVAGAPEALLDTGSSLYVSVGGVISESTDDGDTWQERYRGADHGA